ncbi:MAG TPA: phosphatidylglycerol lysyltransferase domain-containing protein [Candidatus Dormibacteraeota bacterium]|nr:phosphatidylglycerol lysyltransferase domain-containing protein [Candidatus Dormibacteraeota bacterium]
MASQATHDHRPGGGLLRAGVGLVALADTALSLEAWGWRSPQAHAAERLLLDVIAPMRPAATLVAGVAAIYLATRPKRAFRRMLVGLVTAAGLLSLVASEPGLLAAAGAVCLALLQAGWLWPEEGDPVSSRVGWSMLFAVAAAAAGTGWLVVLAHRGHRLLAWMPLLAGLALAAVVSGIALLDRNPPLPGEYDLGQALRRYREQGRSGVCPFALMRDKRHFWSSDRVAFLGFGCRVGVALVLGPGIGPEAALPRLYAEFLAACRVRGWRPAFYQVAEGVANRTGARVRLVVGSEAVIDVDRFGLDGPAMARLRHEVSRARRRGVGVRVVAEPDLEPEELAAIRDLAARVEERRPFGPMAFSTGRWGDPPGVERLVGLAHDGEGRLVAYVTWLVLPAASTVVLDEVKRAPGAPGGAVDLLIAGCLTAFKGRVARASLGLAPVVGAQVAARLAGFEGFLRRALRVANVSPGLYAFKAKFAPSWEPRYLLVETVLDLPRVALAGFLLHYPELGRRVLPRLGRALPMTAR